VKNITIKTLRAFDKKSNKLMTNKVLEELYDYLLLNPTSGDLIKGTGGVRKIRWKTGKSNKGKSSGVRVIYYYDNDLLIILLSLYAKSEKENLTISEKNTIRKILPQIISNMKEDL
tara:strand:- start:1069 stop:1416 length:348 start_codon:yes stop_codon:yes gene_type:complete